MRKFSFRLLALMIFLIAGVFCTAKFSGANSGEGPAFTTEDLDVNTPVLYRKVLDSPDTTIFGDTSFFEYSAHDLDSKKKNNSEFTLQSGKTVYGNKVIQYSPEAYDDYNPGDTVLVEGDSEPAPLYERPWDQVNLKRGIVKKVFDRGYLVQYRSEDQEVTKATVDGKSIVSLSRVQESFPKLGAVTFENYIQALFFIVVGVFMLLSFQPLAMVFGVALFGMATYVVGGLGGIGYLLVSVTGILVLLFVVILSIGN